MSILYRILVWNSLVLFSFFCTYTCGLCTHVLHMARACFWSLLDNNNNNNHHNNNNRFLFIMMSWWCHDDVTLMQDVCCWVGMCEGWEVPTAIVHTLKLKRDIFTGQASKYSLTVHAKHLQSLPAVECLKLQCGALFEVYCWSPAPLLSACHHSHDEWSHASMSVHYCSSLPKWWEVPPSIHTVDRC